MAGYHTMCMSVIPIIPPIKHKQEFLEKLSLYRKTYFCHVLGCGAGVYGESGSVNQCGTKDKVYGCKSNLNY